MPINWASAVGLRQARNSLLTPRPHFTAPSCSLVTECLAFRAALLLLGASSDSFVPRNRFAALATSGWNHLLVDDDPERRIAFSKPTAGKRGYNEDEVDAFLDRVEQEMRGRVTGAPRCPPRDR